METKQIKSQPVRPATKFKFDASKVYTFHNDPGHGWLEVDRAEIDALGIAQTISRYSYQNGTKVYLEEDSDAGKFMEAYKKIWGVEVPYIENYVENTPIRNYYNYQA